MIRMALALVALAIPTQATAASWRMVAEGDRGTKMWVDDSSIVHGKDYTAAWVRMIGADATYSTSLVAMRCGSRSFMYLKSTYYGKNREPIDLDDVLDKKWDIVVPDTILDGVMNDLCGGR
jgi:hypothetical protein